MSEAARFRSFGEAPAEPAAGLRVALFTDTFRPQLNGVVRSLERLADALRERGGEILIVAPASEGLPEDEHVVGWPSVPFWGYPELRIAPVRHWEAMQLIRTWRPSLVHVATPAGIGLAGRGAALSLGVPLVSSYHTHLATYAPHYGMRGLDSLLWSYLAWFHNGCRRTLVPTQAVGDELRGRGFRNLALWTRGVDARRFHPAHRCDALRAELGASEERPLVIYVGRLADEKGLDTLFAAMHRVAGRRPGGPAFAVAGDGPSERACRRLAPEGTRFVGRIEGAELSRFYASADLFVFPSTTDSFGNVQLEAMASGVPVLAADTAVSREVLGATGTFCTGGDGEGFAAAIAHLLDDASRLRERARASRTRAERWSWDAVWDSLFAEYAAVCGRSRPSERATAA